MKIAGVRALEILDSRGNPTLQAEVRLADGTRGRAQVPSGASTGRHEARELRDGDAARYGGKGVLRAVRNVDEVLGPAVEGLNAEDQSAVDARLCEVDGTPDKSRLGANAILAVSCGVARASAARAGVPLWKYLAGERVAKLPVPMVNIISGGLHAGRNLDFQDFLAMPRTNAGGYARVFEAMVRVHRKTGELLRARGCVLTGVADEGGWGPLLASNEDAVATLRDAIDASGCDMDIALDIAATHFGRQDAGAVAEMLSGWVERYGVRSIEDALSEDDWDGWKLLTQRLGRMSQLVGDDLFATDLARLNRGIADGVANAVLVKMNQVGTLTQTLAVVDRAREAGYAAVVSARSGETEDSFLADLAVATGAGQIKIGSVTRSERLAKYNRLLEIEQWEWVG